MKKNAFGYLLVFLASVFFAHTASAHSGANLICVQYSKTYVGHERDVFTVSFDFSRNRLARIVINRGKGNIITVDGSFLGAVREDDITRINLRESGLDDGVYELFVVLSKDHVKENKDVVSMVSVNFNKEKHLDSVEKIVTNGKVTYNRIKP